MNQSKEVAAWLDSYDNPMNEVVRRVRDIILHADPRIEEGLEGDAPTFSYRGTLASIFPESKKHASLMVERGAEIPGHHPRLEGSNDPKRVMKIHDPAEANAAKDDLQHLVRAWCDWRDAEGAQSEEPKAKATRKPAAKRKPASKKKAAAKKKTARPAAKKSSSSKRTDRAAAKKSAAKKSKSRGKSARPATKNTRKRSGPRSRGR